MIFEWLFHYYQEFTTMVAGHPQYCHTKIRIHFSFNIGYNSSRLWITTEVDASLITCTAITSVHTWQCVQFFFYLDLIWIVHLFQLFRLKQCSLNTSMIYICNYHSFQLQKQLLFDVKYNKCFLHKTVEFQFLK